MELGVERLSARWGSNCGPCEDRESDPGHDRQSVHFQLYLIAQDALVLAAYSGHGTRRSGSRSPEVSAVCPLDLQGAAWSLDGLGCDPHPVGDFHVDIPGDGERGHFPVETEILEMPPAVLPWHWDVL